MSEAVGTLAIGETGEEVFIGREWVQNKNFSEDTARLVDSEVKRIVEDAHSRCRKLLEENLDALHRIAQALLDRETITGADIDLLMVPCCPGKGAAGAWFCHARPQDLLCC